MLLLLNDVRRVGLGRVNHPWHHSLLVELVSYHVQASSNSLVAGCSQSGRYGGSSRGPTCNTIKLRLNLIEFLHPRILLHPDLVVWERRTGNIVVDCELVVRHLVLIGEVPKLDVIHVIALWTGRPRL